MPIYEYRCTKGHTFDTMQRFSDEPLTKCEICGAPAQRVFHAPAVHFKGSGFYNTDYGTRKRSREKESREGASAESGGSSDAKKESTASASSESSSSSSSDSSSDSSSSKKSESTKTKAA